jgi:hypothetical protein
MTAHKNNRWKDTLYLAFLFPVLFLYMNCLPARSYAMNESTQVKKYQLNREALQAAVVSHADRFMAIVGQAAFDFERELPTREARLNAARRKVYTMSAVVTISTGPDPAVAMLDMVVLSSLNRMVWVGYWRPKVFGEPATIMVDAFQKTEDDIYSIAAKVLTRRQIMELRELIAEWHARHPGQTAVDFIRFSDFGDLGRKPELKKIKAPGGLLAPVKQAVQAADEIRLTSERAMFLITKLQLIMGLQAELIYKELVMQPEVTSLLNNVTDFKNQIGALPEQISNERQAALKDISKLISGERKAVLKAFDERESKLRAILNGTQATMDRADALLSSLQQTMVSAEKIMEKTESTGMVFNDLVASVDRLATRLDAGKKQEPGKPFDINAYIPALEKLNQTVREATVLVGTVDQSGGPMIQELVREINTAAEKRIDHAFWLMIILFAFAGAIGVLIVFVHHRMTRKDKMV